MADSPDQQAKSGEKAPQEWQGKSSLSVEEADRLSEHFTPMWEQEEADQQSSTMRGLAPPGPAESPATEPPKPAPEAGAQNLSSRKQTMLGVAPPIAPAAEPPAEPAFSPKKTVLGLAPPTQAQPAAAPPVAAAPVAADPMANQPQAASLSTAPAVAPFASADEFDTSFQLPKKNQKVVFAVLGGALALLLIVGIKALVDHSSKSSPASTRVDSITAAAHPARPAPAATSATTPTTAAAAETAAPAAHPAPTSAETTHAAPTTKTAKAKTKKHRANHAARSRPVRRHTTRSVAAFPAAPAHRHVTRPKGGSGSIVRQTPF